VIGNKLKKFLIIYNKKKNGLLECIRKYTANWLKKSELLIMLRFKVKYIIDLDLKIRVILNISVYYLLYEMVFRKTI